MPTIDYYYCPKCGHRVTEEQIVLSQFETCVCNKSLLKDFKKEYVE